MIELEPHPHATLIRRWAEFTARGQVEAGWWRADIMGGGEFSYVSNPAFDPRYIYKIGMTTKHPHYQLAQKWDKVKDICAGIRRGAWAYEIELSFHDNAPIVLNRDYFETDVIMNEQAVITIKKTKHHPDNCKPKLKLVDMFALPIGSAILHAENRDKFKLVAKVGSSHLGGIFEFSSTKIVFEHSDKWRIAEQEGFTYWGGGECPVPDGLLVQVIMRSGSDTYKAIGKFLVWAHGDEYDGKHAEMDIIAYRIIGLADGWTDDPAKVSV
jgi:hypothetical protein